VNSSSVRSSLGYYTFATGLTEGFSLDATFSRAGNLPALAGSR